MFELQALAKGLPSSFDAEGTLPECGARRREARAPDPHQPAGQCHQVHVAGSVAFRVRYAREMATVEIEDTGPGLTVKKSNSIFEPFARGTASPRPAPGAGLGLTIAKMLTDLMGGELSVASTPGEGSVFTVKLFLPEVHRQAWPRGLCWRPHACAGLRRGTPQGAGGGQRGTRP
jgi:hypothetical protein